MSCKKTPERLYAKANIKSTDSYEEELYEAYQDTFSDKERMFRGKPIKHKEHPLVNGKSGTFWHIITTKDDGKDREIDFERASYIKYPAHVLDYCVENCDKIKIWQNRRKRKNRVVLWCEEIGYAVILEKRKDYYIFWTAYPINRRHTYDNMKKEYERSIKNNDEI